MKKKDFCLLSRRGWWTAHFVPFACVCPPADRTAGFRLSHSFSFPIFGNLAFKQFRFRVFAALAYFICTEKRKWSLTVHALKTWKTFDPLSHAPKSLVKAFLQMMSFACGNSLIDTYLTLDVSFSFLGNLMTYNSFNILGFLLINFIISVSHKTSFSFSFFLWENVGWADNMVGSFFCCW